MKKILFLFLSIFLLQMPASAQPGKTQKVLRVSDRSIITFEQMIEDLKRVSIVFVGELHDEPEHHRQQLQIIRAVNDTSQSVAIGLEMFRADSQRMLDSWVSRSIELKQFLPAYYDNWSMPWPLYRDIFLYARDHEISMQGLNIPDGIARKIATTGFDSLTADEKKLLPPGISCNVDPKYMEFIRKAYAGHHGQGKGFVNFCEAQMVWDKSMAWRVMGYLKKNPGKRMVVLAGIGHAWKRGISEQLEPEAKLSYRVVLPKVPDQLDGESTTINDADYLLLTD